MSRKKLSGFSWMIPMILLIMFSIPSYGEVSTDPINTALERLAATNLSDESAITRIFRNLDITTKSAEDAFIKKMHLVAEAHNLDAKIFESKLRGILDKKRYEKVNLILRKVYGQYGKDLGVVIRTGSSGIRHLELAGKRQGHAGYRLLFSDDDISFVGKEAVQAAKYFNQLVEKEGLETLKVKGFDIVNLKNIRGIDLHMLNLLEEEKFVGEAAMAGIKKEMLVKGAVIAENEGGKLVSHAESLSSYIKNKASSLLANELDEKLIREAVKKYGAMSMVGSCERQITGAHGGWEKLSDPEKAKYVLRQRIALEESGALATLAKMSPDRARQQIEHLKKLKAKGNLTKGELKWLRKLRANNIELVFEHIPYKLNPVIAKARESGRSLAGSPEARKALDELTVGFVLMRDHILEIPEEQILAKLRKMAGGNRDLYRMLYTSFRDGKELSAALDAWLGAGLSREAFVEILLKAEGKLERLRLIKERRAAFEKGSAEARALREAEVAVSTREGDRFLVKLLKSPTGRKVFVGVMASAGGAYIFKKMYRSYMAGTLDKDLSNAAMALVEFVPGVTGFKLWHEEGLTPGVVFSFVKEALYFTPYWPLVLTGDVVSLGVDVGSSVQLQSNNNGMVDILVYAGEYGEDGRFKRLVLPNAAANQRRVIDKAGLRDFFFTTQTVVVPVSGMNKTYRISNLAKVSNGILDQIFVENDPVSKKLRKAAETQLTKVSHRESWARIEKGNPFSGMFEYAKCWAGFSTICKKSPHKWCKFFRLLQKKIEARREYVKNHIMIPALVRAAEAKHAHWMMGTQPPVKELKAVQKKLEMLRVKPLPVNLVQEVRKRADEAVAKVVKDRGTHEKQILEKGKYWQAALAAYTNIYRQNQKMVGSVTKKLNLPSKTVNRMILRFPWSGDYVKDAESAAASLKGFYHGAWGSWVDVKKLKGNMPDPYKEAVDRKALAILAEVQLRWRMAMDSSGSPGKDVSISQKFKEEYKEARAKVKILYEKMVDFQALIEKEAKITHGKLVLGKQTRFSVKITGETLRKIQNGRHLQVVWHSPHGDFGSDGKGFRVNYTTTHLLPVKVEAVLFDTQNPMLKGTLAVTVPVQISKGTFRLALNPSRPESGEFIRAEVVMPDRYVNAYKFHYAWRGKGCRVEDKDSFFVAVTAPKKGKATVFARITAEDKKGKMVFLANAGVAFGVGKEKTGKPDEQETANQDAGEGESSPNQEAKTPVEEAGKAGQGQGSTTSEEYRFSGSVPSIWKGGNDKELKKFRFDRDEAVVPAGEECRGASVSGSVDGWFEHDAFAPKNKQEILKRLTEKKAGIKPGRNMRSHLCYGKPSIVPFAIDDFKGYLLEQDEIYCNGWGSFTGFVGGAAKASGEGWVVKDGKIIAVRYWVGGSGCYDNRHRSFLESQTRAAQAEARSILASLHLTKTSSFTKTPYTGPQLDGSDVLRVTLAALPDRPSFLGEQVEITARVTGGKPPYSYKWTGDHGGKGKNVFFGSRKAGDHTLSVTVTDAEGISAKADITIQVEALEVEVVKTAPADSKVVVGTPVHFRARIKEKKNSQLEILWQPHPEVAFQPFEKSTTTTAIFTRPGTYKIWVQVFLVQGSTRTTVGESEQLKVEVIQPAIELSADRQKYYVGEQVVLTAQETPRVSRNVIDFWWELKGKGIQKGAFDDSRKYSFILQDTKPVTVTVHARAKDGGIDLGKKSMSFTARPYKITVSKPERVGPAPWKWDMKLGRAVPLPQAIAVFQDAEIHCSVTPDPKEKIRYRWSVSPKGCTVSAPASRSTYLNAHETGTYQVTVSVRDKNGIELGRGGASFAVTVSQRDQDIAKQKAEDQEKAKKLLQEARKLWKDGKLDQALAKGFSAGKLAPKDKEISNTLNAMQKQKKQVDDSLKKSARLLQQGKLSEAAKVLQKAEQINEKYQKIIALKQDISQAMELRRKNQAAEKLRKQAVVLWGKGNLDKAIQQMQEAERTAPDNAKIAKALKAMRRQKKQLDNALSQADGLIDQKEFQQVKQILRRAANINDASPGYKGMIEKLAQAEKLAKTPGATGGYWQLVGEKGSIGRECAAKENAYYRHTVSGFGGDITITKMVRKHNKVFCKLEGQWQSPAEKLIPGQTIQLPVTIHRLVDTGKYGCEMTVYFDLYDMECGTSGAGGRIGSVTLDRKGPSSLQRSISWKVKDAFRKQAGEKLTIRACYYAAANICGKSQGMKYYYEWVPDGGLPAGQSVKSKENPLNEIQSQQDNARDKMAEGQKQWQNGQLGVAIASLGEAAGIDPSSRKIAKVLKSMQSQKRLIDAALKETEKYVGQDKFKKAKRSLEKAGTVSKNYPPYVEMRKRLKLAKQKHVEHASTKQDSITIISATYGGNCGITKGNVTSHIAKECNGKSICRYNIDYKKIGDPAVGCRKTYSVQYRCGNISQVFKKSLAAEAGWGDKFLLLNCQQKNQTNTAGPNPATLQEIDKAIPMLAGSPNAVIIKNPRVNGVALDYCREWAKNCGKPAADAWCQANGYSESVDHVIKDNTPPTRIISTGKICNESSCDRIIEIKCRKKIVEGAAKHGTAADAPPAPTGKEQTIKAKYGPPSSVDTWTHYSIPLTAETFGIDRQSFEQVMANVRSFRIATEMYDGKDAGCIDTVRIGGRYSSDFSNGTNDWSAAGDGTMRWVSSGGSSGGYLQISDWATGEEHLAVAPSSWSGNWRQLIGKRIEFDYKTNHIGYAAFVEISSKQQNRLGVVADPLVISQGSDAVISITPYPVSSKNVSVSITSSDTKCISIPKTVVLYPGQTKCKAKARAVKEVGTGACDSVITISAPGYGKSRITLSVNQ